jgi:two-component system LytT family response regulator
MIPIRVLVADDEPPARRKLLRFLKAQPEIAIAGETGTVASTVSAIQEHRPDLVFLDVQMPDGSGFDVLRALPDPDSLHVVFVTAHDGYALQAFDVHAFDYLLKPVHPGRFEAVMTRVRKAMCRDREPGLERRLESMLRDLQTRAQYPARLLLDLGEKSIFVAAASIDYVESARNYLDIHSQGQVFTVRATLDTFAAQLDPERFVRVNRSQVVNLDSVREMRPWFHGEYRVVLKNGATLNWTRRFSPGRPARP